MMTHDDAFLDSVAVLALGALPEAEARDVAAHVLGCDECRREYEELRSVANLVGYTAETPAGGIDEVTSARMKSGVMRRVRAGSAAGSANEPRRATPWPYYAAAAALVAAILTGIQTVSLRSDNEQQQQRIAQMQHELTANTAAQASTAAQQRVLEQHLAQMVAPGAKHFPVANGEVIEANGKILIAFSHLPAAPSGKVYQAWTLARGAKAVAPSITFVPDASGVAVIELPESAANLAAVAVSVEPPSGSKAPTSKPTFVRALS
jgi:hypothetical protein